MKLPAITCPLDFGDQAAHGAKNVNAAGEAGPRLLKKIVGFYTYYYQATQCAALNNAHIFCVRVPFVCYAESLYLI